MSINVPPPGVGGRYLMDGRLYEIINITSELISFRDANGTRALFLTTEDLDGLLMKKQIVLAECPPIEISASARFLDSTDPQVISAKRKHFYVMAIRKAFQGELPHDACSEELKLLAKKFGDAKPPGFTTLWTWTAACKKANWSPWSLLKHQSDRPRGKKTPEDTRAIVLRYIKESYLSKQKNTVALVHRLIKGQIINDNITRNSTNSRLLHTPSISTVRREIKRLCHLYTDKCRLGAKAAEKKNKFGPAWKDPDYLLEQCEIDCQSPCDILIVNNNGELLGKVVHLQAIIEVKSNKITGYDLSLTPPCAEKTLKSLRMALQAVPGEESERGKMVMLSADRGIENNNIDVKTSTKTLGIELILPPPGVPDARPHIEAFFRTVNTFIHSLPGTTFSNPIECGNYNSAAHACLTIEQLQDGFSDWLENAYHNQPQERGRSRMSPNARWAKAMAKQLPPEKYSKADLDAALRSTKFCSICHGTVRFDHLEWSSPALCEIERDLKKGQKAIISYDITDLGQVWVAHPARPNELVRADARDRAYQMGLTLYEHRLVQGALHAEQQEFSVDVVCVTLLRIRQNIEQIQKEFALRKKVQPRKKDKVAKAVQKVFSSQKRELPTTNPVVLPHGASVKCVYIEEH